MSAITFPVVDTKREHLGWLAREDDFLLEAILTGKNDPTLLDVCTKFHRDPFSVLVHLRDSDIPDMLGFDCPPGSEEEAEFNGLALSGVGLRAAFLWCTASDDRPSAQELADAMVYGDARGLTHFARMQSLVACCQTDVQALRALMGVEVGKVASAVIAVQARFDIPTPRQVLRQLSGFVPSDKPFDWTCPQTTKKGGKGSYVRKKSTRTSASTFSGAYKPKRKSRWTKWKKSSTKTTWANA